MREYEAIGSNFKIIPIGDRVCDSTSQGVPSAQRLSRLAGWTCVLGVSFRQSACRQIRADTFSGLLSVSLFTLKGTRRPCPADAPGMIREVTLLRKYVINLEQDNVKGVDVNAHLRAHP